MKILSKSDLKLHPEFNRSHLETVMTDKPDRIISCEINVIQCVDVVVRRRYRRYTAGSEKCSKNHSRCVPQLAFE